MIGYVGLIWDKKYGKCATQKGRMTKWRKKYWLWMTKN